LKPRNNKQVKPQDKRKGVQERAKHTDRTWGKRLREYEVKITVNVIATFKSYYDEYFVMLLKLILCRKTKE
jgi:hypothetical protein